jgi:hypothetical protein
VDLPEELPTQGEIALARPICAEPIVPHPLEATNAVHCIIGFAQFIAVCSKGKSVVNITYVPWKSLQPIDFSDKII